MIRINIVLIALCTSFVLNAQNFGYLGKKNFIDVKTVSSVPVLANIAYSFSDGDGLIGQWRFGYFNTGIHVSIGRTVKQNIAFSLETGIDFQSYNENEYQDGSSYIQKVTAYSIMPKIEFASKRYILPLGIHHQIGLGFYNLKNEFIFSPDFSLYSEPLKGITLLYGFMIRTAISKKLFINYGARYTMNYTFGYPDFWSTVIPYYMYEHDMQKRFNLVSIDLGLTFAF